MKLYLWSLELVKLKTNIELKINSTTIYFMLPKSMQNFGLIIYMRGIVYLRNEFQFRYVFKYVV